MEVLEASGKRVFWFDRLQSTMDTARELSSAEVEPVVVAVRQDSGRGRQGRRWLSPEGGLWCSVVWQRVPQSAAPYLFLLAGAAVVELLSFLGVPTRIKLPNDVFWNDRKIAGLLVEKSGESVIIGIGINVNNEMRARRENAVSCVEITGRKEDLRLVLTRLLDILEDYRIRFPQQEQFLLQKWGQLLRT